MLAGAFYTSPLFCSSNVCTDSNETLLHARRVLFTSLNYKQLRGTGTSVSLAFTVLIGKWKSLKDTVQ